MLISDMVTDAYTRLINLMHKNFKEKFSDIEFKKNGFISSEKKIVDDFVDALLGSDKKIFEGRYRSFIKCCSFRKCDDLFNKLNDEKSKDLLLNVAKDFLGQGEDACLGDNFIKFESVFEGCSLQFEIHDFCRELSVALCYLLYSELDPGNVLLVEEVRNLLRIIFNIENKINDIDAKLDYISKSLFKFDINKEVSKIYVDGINVYMESEVNNILNSEGFGFVLESIAQLQVCTNPKNPARWIFSLRDAKKQMRIIERTIDKLYREYKIDNAVLKDLIQKCGSLFWCFVARESVMNLSFGDNIIVQGKFSKKIVFKLLGHEFNKEDDDNKKSITEELEAIICFSTGKQYAPASMGRYYAEVDFEEGYEETSYDNHFILFANMFSKSNFVSVSEKKFASSLDTVRDDMEEDYQDRIFYTAVLNKATDDQIENAVRILVKKLPHVLIAVQDSLTGRNAIQFSNPKLCNDIDVRISNLESLMKK